MIPCDSCQVCQESYTYQSEGLPPITNLFLGLTEDCTHRCSYPCFCEHKPQEMTYELAMDGLIWLSKQSQWQKSKKQIKISYFGGEPLLKWHDIIVPLTITARKLFGDHIKFYITTNGYLLDQNKIDFMKKYNFGPLLSFDGVRECQDINRPLKNGEGTYDKTVENAKLLLKSFSNITMRMTVHKPTLKTFYDNHVLGVNLGFPNLFAAFNTFADWEDADYMELENQMYRIADLFISMVREGKYVGFNPLLKTLNKIRMVDGEIPRRIIKKPNVGKCGIGSNGAVTLTPNGDFITCQEVFTINGIRNYFKVGNISTGLDNNRRLAIINDLDQSKFRCSNPAICETCQLKIACDGACSARNYEMNGDINVIPEPHCREENIRFKVMRYIDNALKDNQLYFSKMRAKKSQQSPQQQNHQQCSMSRQQIRFG